jgi:hypothetical protein
MDPWGAEGHDDNVPGCPKASQQAAELARRALIGASKPINPAITALTPQRDE